jgi:hypothetical protein
MTGGLFNNGSGSPRVDIRALMDSGIPELVSGLLEMGALVSLGTTRDRGALSITITVDGEYDREYFRDASEASDYLRRATDTLRARLGPPATADPDPVPLARKRRSRLA